MSEVKWTTGEWTQIDKEYGTFVVLSVRKDEEKSDIIAFGGTAVIYSVLSFFDNVFISGAILCWSWAALAVFRFLVLRSAIKMHVEGNG